MPRLAKIINRILLTLSFSAFSLGVQAETDKLEDGFQYLFDGSSLTGWRQIGGNASYEVRDGHIVGTHGPGFNSFLRTDKTFGDFILKMEMKWDEAGNSGILFRAQQRDGNGIAYGYQYELDPSDRAWSAGIYDEARRGWIANLEGDSKKAAREAIKLNDWNEIELSAIGGHIKTWINGVPASDIVDSMDLSGYIALQVHAGKSGIMRWRNIRIKELGQQQWDTSSMRNDAFWKAHNNTGYTSKKQLSDFAFKATLPLCEDPTTITFRKKEKGSFVTLAINNQAVKLGFNNDVNTTKTFLEKTPSAELLLTAKGAFISAVVNGKEAGRIRRTTLTSKGTFSIEPGKCNRDNYVLPDMAWIDLSALYGEKKLYQTVETPPAPVLTTQQALASFSLAEDFNIELVAAEPMIEDPIAMDWDENGDLYVVEMRSFMNDANGSNQYQTSSRISRLRDTNGDGVMDEARVFLDNLVLPRAVTVVNEGVLIAEPPNLWLCRNNSFEEGCGEKIRLGNYGDMAANIEHMDNGLLLGLDNWLYNAKSGRKIRIKEGELIEGTTIHRGQWGISKDNWGRLFYNNNSVYLQGDYYPDTHLANIKQPVGMGKKLTEGRDKVYSIRVNPGVNRAYIDGVLREDGRLASPTAVSGLTVYRGNQFPDDYLHHVFVPEPGANAVAQFQLREQGLAIAAEHITYPNARWGQQEFLASTDERFRPVDAKVGPDGALYIIDMYRGIIQEQAFLTDELREQAIERGLDKPLGYGRIWRVTHKDGPQNTSTPMLKDLNQKQLIALLRNANGWHRDQAQRLLQKGSDLDSSAIVETLYAKDTLAAVHALWTLEGLNQLNNEHIDSVLAHGDPQLQLQALRAAYKLVTLETLVNFSRSSQEKSEALQQQLILNLGRFIEEKAANNAILELLSNSYDARGNSIFINEAVRNVSTGMEKSFYKKAKSNRKWKKASKNSKKILSKLENNVKLAAAREKMAKRKTADSANTPDSELYKRCAACHGDSGQGVAGMAPALTGSPRVIGDPQVLGNIFLNGLQGPLKSGSKEWNGFMPPHISQSGFDAPSVAGLMTFLRTSIGNSASAVSIEDAEKILVTASKRSTPWTIDELRKKYGNID